MHKISRDEFDQIFQDELTENVSKRSGPQRDDA